MIDKKNPATLGQASTGKSFITEAARDYRASAGIAEPRDIKFSEISCFSSFSRFSSIGDTTDDPTVGDQLAAVSSISSVADGFAQQSADDTFSNVSSISSSDAAPIPLHREIMPGMEFPVDELGKILGGAVRGIVDIVKCPTALTVGSVLSTASLAVMGHADILHPADGSPDEPHKVPLSLFMLGVGDSGERKSASDRLASSPIKERERELNLNHNYIMDQYRIDFRAWDLARQAKEKAAKGDRDATRAALQELGPPPEEPLFPKLTLSEPTWEGLVNTYAGGYPTIGLFSDEGGTFIGGHAMSEDAKLRSASGISKLWDGSPIDRNRGKEKFILPGRRLAVHLMAQPEVALKMVADPILSKQGYVARFLVSAPPSTKGTRFHSERQPGTDEAIRAYHNRILGILRKPLPLREGTTNELDPRTLRLSPEASDRWIAFSDDVERQQLPDGQLAKVSAFSSKIAEQVLRIAGVLTLVDNLEAEEIEDDTLIQAITIAEYYLIEAVRMFDASSVSRGVSEAAKLLDWLNEKWTEEFIDQRQIYQHGPYSLRSKEDAQKAIAVLVEHHWLIRVEGDVNVGSRKSKTAYRVVRGA